MNKITIGLVTLLLVSLCGCTVDSADMHSVQGNLYVSFDISPDGKQIVFSGAGNGGKDLYLFDLRTQTVTPLTNTASYEAQPSFSPDGRSIVYSFATRLDKPHYLFVRSLDGSRVRQLTSGSMTSDEYPTFSPDGQSIVFARAHTFYRYVRGEDTWGNDDVYSIHVDGTGLKRITHGDYGGELRPRFFPDGKSIIFEEVVSGESTLGD